MTGPVAAATTSPPCPVCLTPNTQPLMTVDARDYWYCKRCAARFLDPAQRPTRAEERAHLQTHENALDDSGYRRFLNKLAEPLRHRLPPESRGLDYGCGPAPALAAMLGEAGFAVTLYDPVFHADLAALENRYDFITCTEVAEHFHNPHEEFARLSRLLNPNGWLAIMTCFQTDDARFADWHYRRDPTHVVFYRAATLHHIARQNGLNCEIVAKDVALMNKV